MALVDPIFISACNALTAPPSPTPLSSGSFPSSFKASLILHDADIDTDSNANANDTSYITIWLPPKKSWNGRYAATGGGGLAAGVEYNMISPLSSGFATSSTDGGLTLNHTIQPNSALWGLNPDGSLDETLPTDLGWRSTADTALASKSIISQFYGEEEKYAYFIGCSQGERQGYAAAAKYPTLFDGILAAAPAVAMEYVGPAEFWPVVVMANEGEVVPSCVFEKYQAALLEMCDPLDGLADGMISDYTLLNSCSGRFNTSSLIGEEVTCAEANDTSITITDRHSTIVSNILGGPIDPSTGQKYWFGATPGANFSGVADTLYNPNTGPWTPKPSPPAAGWLQNCYCAKLSGEIVAAAASSQKSKREALSITKLTYKEFFVSFNKSISLGGPYLGDSYLDLTPFSENSGKLLSWVGLAE
ncbi:Tannase/feruloyl esterase [Aspergillus oleicola]